MPGSEHTGSATTAVLSLDPAMVRKARELAAVAGEPIVEMARTHTTVSVERAVLRLGGLDGASPGDGMPWVNHLADAVAVSAFRSGKRSTTRWLSRFTRIVPNWPPRRKGRVRGMMLPSSTPLRTVLVGFLTYGSSLSFRPCDRTRFLHRNPLAVNLLMTGRMKQNAVFCTI